MSRNKPKTPSAAPDTWLHVHAQAIWHSEVIIEGTRDGLRALRDAIDEALRTNREGTSPYVFAGDGEGYTAIARVRTSDQIRDSILPYVDEIARDPRTRAAG